jgi:2-oxoglutarate dehydrogenase E2 component (dihydrolipoamide succinyltransferase)
LACDQRRLEEKGCVMADVTVPRFPESVTEGTLLAWRKRAGEAVARGEILAEIETDKVVFEVPAAEDGVLVEIGVAPGATVVSGQVIGRLGAGAVTPAPAVQAKGAKPSGKPPAPSPPVLPAARREAAARGVDTAQLAGSGKGGRVLKEDVMRAAAAPTPGAPPAPAFPEVAPADRPSRRVPLSRLRARIAERLKEAQNTAAVLTTFNEVNMAPVMALRARHREQFEREYGVKLGLMSFFVKASIDALKRFPEVNASIEGREVVYHGFYDIGIAISSTRGLVVPILRDADRLAMAQIEAAIKDYAERAQSGRLTLEELTGGTFSITNGGVFGSLLSTPILNPPQSAILGMHKIQERPVAENGEVVIRPMMYLALSYDHRLVDGREAVQFLIAIKEALEEPSRLLLEI